MLGRRDQEDFEAEVRAHLELEAERLRKLGASTEEASAAARRRFGNIGATIDRFDAAQPWSWLFDVGKDLRHALRTLAKAPGFSAAVILTLALGIGANSAMFTIVNAVLFRPLPFPESQRVVSISRANESMDQGSLDDGTFRALAEGGLPQIQHVAATRGNQVTLSLAGKRQPLTGVSVSPQYFAVYRMTPIRGRTFTADEDQPGAPDVVILSEALWRSTFGADSATVGRSVILDGKPHTVVGIVAAVPLSVRRTQFWMPLRLGPPKPGTTWYLTVVARMQSDATLESLRAAANTLGKRLEAEQPVKGRPDDHHVWNVMTLHERRYGDTRRPLLLLWGAVAVLLAIACANIANLSLARASRREREFALRLALGASRMRIVRYVLCECLLLSTSGAVLGTLLAGSTLGYFVRSSPGVVATASGIGVDGTALAFTLAIAVGTAVLFGLIPAFRTARAGVSFTFMSGTPRAAGSRREQFVRRSLIVAQLATALVMLTGASIVTKTLVRVASIDAGFEAANLIGIRPYLGTGYTPATAQAFYDDFAQRLRRETTVRQVALADASPLSGVRVSQMLLNDDQSTTRMDMIAIDTGYFSTIGARLREGRGFTEGDRQGAPEVVIINETLARTLFPGGSAIGRPLHRHDPRTVIGVVNDIKQRGLEAPANGIAFTPVAQTARFEFPMFMVRTAPGAAGLQERARKIIQEMDPNQDPPYVTVLEDRRNEFVAPRRFTALLASAFAGLAALLALVGLYGVLSYLVAERTREIGIRVALGADTGRVLRLVIGNGLALTAIGVALGACAAVFTVRLLKSTVYDMSVYDPWMFSGSAALLMIVALIASWIPARRAAAVEPVTALRIE